MNGVHAIRSAVALSDRPGVSFVRVTGEHAWDALDRVLPTELYVRDGQLRPSLLLDESGLVRADVMVACEDDDLWLRCDGVTGAVLAELVVEHVAPDEEVRVELVSELVSIGIDGPFAWELMSRFDSPSVIGLPYLSLYRPRPGWMCWRTGSTGEYGFELIGPPGERRQIWDELMRLGHTLDVVEADGDALRYCALENWFFDPGLFAEQLTPLELQLQWRVSRLKEFIGSKALAARRAQPWQRITAVVGDAIEAGQAVFAGDERVGRVLAALPAHGRPGFIGVALLERTFAHSGPVYSSDAGLLNTVSPPFVINRSLFIKGQTHTYAAREQIALPEGLSWTTTPS
jgi:glycine cleavage system aminomethyltransferase T